MQVIVASQQTRTGRCWLIRVDVVAALFCCTPPRHSGRRRGGVPPQLTIWSGTIEVGLWPLNPTKGATRWQASTAENEAEFVRRLRAKGISTTVRDTRGREIDGACGQLAATVTGRSVGPARRRHTTSLPLA